MSKVIRSKDTITEPLAALLGNPHFTDFMAAIDGMAKHGRTVFDQDPCQSAFNLGRQSLANDIHYNIDRIKAAQTNKNK